MRVLKWSAVILLVLMVVAGSWFTVSLQSVSAETDAKIDFPVAAGVNRSQLARELFARGLVKNPTTFYLYSKFLGGTILPGTYELSPSYSASVIAERLASGQFKTLKITLLEGWRVEDTERYLVEDQGLTQLANFAAEAEKYEGSLFPDTYEVKIDVTTSELIALLRENFTKRTQKLKVNQEAVILASIVEREAAADSERAAIAGVYVNRLKIGMKLEADPTVQYAKGNWKAVSLSDYRSVISPYNTYLNEGLPPSPICSPGLASIEAALQPANHQYLFFFHAKGETHFSTTYEDHAAKVRQYF